MKYKFLVPATCNLEQHLKDNPPQEEYKHGVNVSNLAYILDCIIMKGISHKKKAFYNERWVHLKAEYLDEILPNYNNCLRYLMENEIIETNGYYIKGVQSKAFRICRNHLEQGWVAIKVERKLIWKIYNKQQKLRKCNPKLEIIEKDRSALIKVLKSPLLRIDEDMAYYTIKKIYGPQKFEKMRNENHWHFDPDDAIDIIRQTQANFRLLIHKINSKEFVDPVPDKSGYRLHSPITQLPKFLRNYLTYNGQPLVSLDLKNSQPYFSLLLLKRKFYKQNGKGFLKLGDFDRELYQLLQGNMPKYKCPIMLPKIAKTLDNQEFPSLKNYINDVCKGVVYDRFLDQNLDEDTYEEKREIVKEQFFEALFGKGKLSNRHKRFNLAYEVPFRIFGILKSYPSTDALQKQNKAFGDEVKDELDHSRLAKLLQRIESHLLLDVVCKQLLQNNPEMPLITIHDSIATTPEYIDHLESTIKKTLNDAVGFEPRLKREYWGGNQEQFLLRAA